MSVWAFACKVESSMNRWFDGSDQDVKPEDQMSFMFEKGSEDSVSTLESYRTTWSKYISQVHSGIGSMMFNVVQLNAFYRELSDYSDVVFMEDLVDINLSRAIVRINDILYPVEYFNRTLSGGKADSVYVDDDTFVNVNDTANQAIDDAAMTDITAVEMTKVIAVSSADSIGFTEDFKASVGGKSIYDLISMKDVIAKTLDVGAGDEQNAGAVGTFMFNSFVINGESEMASLSTVIGLTEEVQIILT